MTFKNTMSDTEMEEKKTKGRKRANNKDEDEIRPNKKRASTAEEIPVTHDSGKGTIYAKSLNLTDLKNTVKGLTEVTNCKFVMIRITSEGMGFLASNGINMLATAFLGLNFFHTYRCDKPFECFVSVEKLKTMVKMLAKWDVVEFMDDEEGILTYSGNSRFKVGSYGTFAHKLHALEPDQEVPATIPDSTFGWHIFLSTEKLKTIVENLDSSVEHILFSIEKDRLTFKGLSESHTIDCTGSCEIPTMANWTEDVNFLFKAKSIDIVKKAFGPVVSGDVQISFNINPTENQSSALKFTYALDKASPQSHFTLYVQQMQLD